MESERDDGPANHSEGANADATANNVVWSEEYLDLIRSALTPGWTLVMSRSKQKPYFVHPDFGKTWHCPVPMPDHPVASTLPPSPPPPPPPPRVPSPVASPTAAPASSPPARSGSGPESTLSDPQTPPGFSETPLGFYDTDLGERHHRRGSRGSQSETAGRFVGQEEESWICFACSFRNSLSSDRCGHCKSWNRNAIWTLQIMYSASHITRAVRLCSADGCGLTACSVWVSSEHPDDPWFSCLDCQEADFLDWSKVRPGFLPLKFMSYEHKQLIGAQCSRQTSPTMPNLPPTPIERLGHTPAIAATLGPSDSEGVNDDYYKQYKSLSLTTKRKAEIESCNGEKWELKYIFNANEIKERTEECSHCCSLVACSLWVSNKNPRQPWFTCLDCQEKYFLGWPAVGPTFPLKTMSATHIRVMRMHCSRRGNPAMPQFTSPKRRRRTPSIKHCHLCGTISAPSVIKFLRCNVCRSNGFFYCSEACRRYDWSRHKMIECIVGRSSASRVESLPPDLLRFVLELLDMPSRVLLGSCSGALKEDVYGRNSDMWTTIDFGKLKPSLASRVTDNSLRGLLIRTKANMVVKSLSLRGCTRVTGSGLAPLRRSHVLEHIDLRLDWSHSYTFGETGLDDKCVVSILSTMPPIADEPTAIPIAGLCLVQIRRQNNTSHPLRRFNNDIGALVACFQASRAAAIVQSKTKCDSCKNLISELTASYCMSCKCYTCGRGKCCPAPTKECCECFKHFCGKLDCKIIPCSECDNYYCGDCPTLAAYCSDCGDAFCDNCTDLSFCSTCTNAFCGGCSDPMRICERPNCSNVSCGDCDLVDFCSFCDTDYCRDCSIICSSCDKHFCDECPEVDVSRCDAVSNTSADDARAYLLAQTARQFCLPLCMWEWRRNQMRCESCRREGIVAQMPAAGFVELTRESWGRG